MTEKVRRGILDPENKKRSGERVELSAAPIPRHRENMKR